MTIVWLTVIYWFKIWPLVIWIEHILIVRFTIGEEENCGKGEMTAIFSIISYCERAKVHVV